MTLVTPSMTPATLAQIHIWSPKQWLRLKIKNSLPIPGPALKSKTFLTYYYYFFLDIANVYLKDTQ